MIGVFVLLAVAGESLAIDWDKHPDVTRSALTVYSDCLKTSGDQDFLNPGEQEIIRFSGEEDTSPLLKRWFNWHFFDAYKDDSSHAMGRHFSGARKSMHHIFSEHAENLLEAITLQKPERIYELTGRILHYMQDVTVPAHVAPIFHYKYFVFDQADYFDEMPQWQTLSFSGSADTCVADKAEAATLFERINQILHDTAHTTRKRIKAAIPLPDEHILAGKTWEVFWVVRNPDHDNTYKNTIKGFAPYGELGNEGFKNLCNGSANEQKACLDFFKDSYNGAITASVKTLLVINSVLQNN